MVLARSTHATNYVQHSLGHLSIQLTSTATLTGYPEHGGRHAADGMDEALG